MEDYRNAEVMFRFLFPFSLSEMNNLIRYGFNVQAIPYLDCSVTNDTLADWYAKGTPRVHFAIYSLVYGILAQIIYVLVMIAMWKLSNTFSVYKIMISLGIYDMVDILVNSFVSGYFQMYGSCFCTNPTLNYVAGSLGLALWCGECLCCLLLVFNRIVDLFSPRIHQSLFGGSKMNVWLLLPFLYCLYFLLFTNPVLFNSAFNGWFFSPFIANTAEEMAMFTNYLQVFNNVAVVATTCVFYILLCIVVIMKYGKMGNIGNVQKMCIIQSILVCTANFEASMVYVYVQFYPSPDWLLLIGHLGWQLANGIPAFVYLIFNKTVRGLVLESIGLKKPEQRAPIGSSATNHGTMSNVATIL